MSEKENLVLCCASAYEQKYYLNPDFEGLPVPVKDELKIMCVLFTEDIGGIFILEFDREGSLKFRVEAAEDDILFDEIGCGLKIKELQTVKKELLKNMELYYQMVYLGKA